METTINRERDAAVVADPVPSYWRKESNVLRDKAITWETLKNTVLDFTS